MQLTITLTAPEPVKLPVHYGHLIQGMIYRGMENPLLSRYLHEQGFQLEKDGLSFSRSPG